MIYVVIIFFISIVGVVGDFFIKLAGSGSKFIDLRWFILGFGLYSSTTFVWFYVMKHMKLATVGVVYSLTTVLFLAIIGTLFFHEKLNLFEIIGIAMAVVSVIFLTKFA